MKASACYETFSVSIFWNTLAREMAKVLYSQTYYDPYLLTQRSPANLQSDAPQKTMSSYFFYVRMQRARLISRRGKTGLKNRQKVPKNTVWVITGSTVVVPTANGG